MCYSVNITNTETCHMRDASNFLKTDHAADYFAGYEAKRAEIAQMGWAASHAKFNAENPVGVDYKSVGMYFYSEGELDALLDAKPKDAAHV